MRYASGAAALEAMRLLRGSRLAMGASPSRRSVSPPPRRFAARRSRSRSPPRRSPRRRSPPRLTPPRRGSPSRRSPPRFRARDLPEYASCTLWIGQVLSANLLPSSDTIRCHRLVPLSYVFRTDMLSPFSLRQILGILYIEISGS